MILNHLRFALMITAEIVLFELGSVKICGFLQNPFSQGTGTEKNAVLCCDSICEKTLQKSPQAFLECNYKIILPIK